MKRLPGGCKMGKMSVTPLDWEDGGKKLLSQQWVISYRFYDSSGATKQVRVSSFNKFNTLEERRNEVKKAKEEILISLEKLGYNPITKKFSISEAPQNAINDTGGLITSLQYTLSKYVCVPDYKGELKSTLKYITAAAKALQIEDKPIAEIKRRDIKLLLEKCAEQKKKFTPATFNRYKKNLSGLFSELVEMEAMEQNPCLGIKKLKSITKQRVLLTIADRKTINDFLFSYDIDFWLLWHIFFHSGSRTTEVLKVKPEHVDLQNQTVNYQMLKGKNYSWVKRPIKDVALPYWQAVVWNCPEGHYIFGEGLRPNLASINRRQIDRRWKRHIVVKLGITSTWYSLKHLNTTETENLLQGGAALQNMESQKMINTVYDVESKTRKNDLIKKVNNPLA